MEQETHQESAGSATAQTAVEDDAAARRLERRINTRLVKIRRDEDSILKLQMRIQRYRQEMHRLGKSRAEKLTLRLL